VTETEKIAAAIVLAVKAATTPLLVRIQELEWCWRLTHTLRACRRSRLGAQPQRRGARDGGSMDEMNNQMAVARTTSRRTRRG